MQLLNVTNLPIYLPLDTAPVPFGDPLTDVAITLASPGVVTVPGYDNPAVNDAISFSIPVGGGTLPVAVVVGTVYYVGTVVSAALGTFTLSTTKNNGAPVNTASAATGAVTAHLISAEKEGTILPFKPNNTVLVVNQTAGPLVLQGAPDLNTTSYGNPQGPGSYVTLATVPANSMALVVLSQDWIRVSTAATLGLIQN